VGGTGREIVRRSDGIDDTLDLPEKARDLG
jgi:hypothetical protein